jgi:hypothetical protein
VSKVDLRLQCGMPCSKLEVSTVQRGTLSGAGYLHQSRVKVGIKIVVAGHFMAFAALLVQAHPQPAVLHVNALDLSWRRRNSTARLERVRQCEVDNARVAAEIDRGLGAPVG